MRKFFLRYISILSVGAILLVSLGYTYQKPKILIIGDSISIGYTPYVKKALEDKAQIFHNEGNAKFTGYGMQNLDAWLGSENWDIIQFNWGLWDLCYRNPGEPITTSNRNVVSGVVTTTKEQYKANLEHIVKRLKQTHAKLIYVTTTYVPANEPGRHPEDAIAYNAIAKEVMKANAVEINDIYQSSEKIHQQDALKENDVHYTKEGYQKLAVEIDKGLNRLLINQ